ncbi:MAG TPA: hypothetical protein VHY37_03365 [Tepidisphaeraceae bacterium]|jgi:hypothetical protein|nr:hypothetical protein [Tepidisphaeraceae bacterium]
MPNRFQSRLEQFAPIVEGPHGLLMPESTARRIEELSKSLPADFAYRRLARKAEEFRLEPGERTDVSLITTDAIDRQGEMVIPSGIDWSGYNRVVTFAHRYDQLPVGSNWWMRSRGNGLIAKTHYPQKPADWGDSPWLPSAVLHLMQQPVPTCTGKSIGFLPLNIREATGSERRERPELAGVPIIDKAAGIEYAVVPVPANPDAQMQAVAKGKALGLFDDALEELICAASGVEAPGVAPFVRGATVRAALLREGQALGTRLREQVRAHIREALEQAMGRV